MPLANDFAPRHRTGLRISHGRITLVFYNEPSPCGGNCLYCIRQPGFTKSVLSNEDTLLAKNCNWDASCQIDARFRQYELTRGRGNKYDIRIKGDSFTNHDPRYLVQYFKGLYDYLNGETSDDFDEARAKQMDAPDRCVWVQVETRPDQITEDWCRTLSRLGVNTVELGVQCLDDEVLMTNRRGHGTAEVRSATRLLREHGFEVGYHMMVGLPGSSDELDYEVLTERLWSPDYSPDCMKIYPCLLLRDHRLQRQLARLAGRREWDVLTDERYLELLNAVYPGIPPSVHVNRIQRLIPPEDIEYGPKQVIDRRIFDGISRCLWQRSLAQTGYSTSGDFRDYRVSSIPYGTGYCIEATVDGGRVVLGYARLTVIDGGVGLVRDLRVLGDMVPVGATSRDGPQHIGIGGAMMREMELVAIGEGCRHLRICPPAGTVRYLESLGFRPDGAYHLRKGLSDRVAMDGPNLDPRVDSLGASVSIGQSDRGVGVGRP